MHTVVNVCKAFGSGFLFFFGAGDFVLCGTRNRKVCTCRPCFHSYRVVLHGKLAVGPLNLLVGGATGHRQHVVQIATVGVLVTPM